tara:strand:+ start:3005 stop:3337 length:333 start_codon:yes stop_codon:yes gene_type:complete
MTEPVRIQLRRNRGYRLREVSRAINGLEAVKVDRTTKWGNPFKPGVKTPYAGGRAVQDKRHAFCLFRGVAPDNEVLVAAARAELRGKNLACWCKPGEPCHADVLLELANA